MVCVFFLKVYSRFKDCIKKPLTLRSKEFSTFLNILQQLWHNTHTLKFVMVLITHKNEEKHTWLDNV